ncbi:hypothetical protein V8E36_002581 [Tilletia maclaganii]
MSSAAAPRGPRASLPRPPTEPPTDNRDDPSLPSSPTGPSRSPSLSPPPSAWQGWRPPRAAAARGIALSPSTNAPQMSGPRVGGSSDAPQSPLSLLAGLDPHARAGEHSLSYDMSDHGSHIVSRQTSASSLVKFVETSPTRGRETRPVAYEHPSLTGSVGHAAVAQSLSNTSSGQDSDEVQGSSTTTNNSSPEHLNPLRAAEETSMNPWQEDIYADSLQPHLQDRLPFPSAGIRSDGEHSKISDRGGGRGGRLTPINSHRPDLAKARSFLNIKPSDQELLLPNLSIIPPPSFGAGLYDGPEDDDDMHGGWTPPDKHPSKSGREPFNRRGCGDGGLPFAHSRASRKRSDMGDDRIHLCSDLRGFLNVATLALLATALVFVFAGWPILTTYLPHHRHGGAGDGPEALSPEDAQRIGYNQATVRSPSGLRLNSSGGVKWNFMRTSLVDSDTPADQLYKMGTRGRRMKLVFSDEFNVDNRTFFPGDDPIWTAQDLYYWGTGDYEYYHPSAITTRGGHLVIRMSQEPINGRNFKSGMLNAWNQMCFTGGRVEVAVQLPGAPDITGYWPAAWLMGNLGRAGYGASTHGMWPYTYNHCSVGTLANQTYGPNGTGGPQAAEMTGVYVAQYGPGLSYLPGQRLSRCTCLSSTDHPGPKNADGTWMGRSSPELDIFEASAIDKGEGVNSMSLQLGPFDSGYNLTRPDLTMVYHPERGDQLNPYTGSVYQQAVSALIKTDQSAYERTDKNFATYGLEYTPASELQNDGNVTWLSGGDLAWTLLGAALGPNELTEIGQRLIPQEPMYPIINFGISSSFTWVDWEKLVFPSEMLIDHVRIWQYEDEINLGCDGLNGAMPTAAYIRKHFEAYFDQNLTTWTAPRDRAGYGKKFPGNALLNECD